MVTWGESQKGADSSMVQEQLRDVEQALSRKLGEYVFKHGRIQTFGCGGI